MLNVKYQIFVSSTFDDMREERHAIVEAILKKKHIPAGMELFSGENRDQFEIIKEWIRECDIFIIVLGGRYGSICRSTKKSFVEMEYDYAVEIGKPIGAVVIAEEYLGDKISKMPAHFKCDDRIKYDRLAAKVTSKMCKFYSDLSELKYEIQSTLEDIINNKSYDLNGWIARKNAYKSFEFGRKYKLLESRWTVTLNNDHETLKGICEATRHIVCTEGIIKTITIDFNPEYNLLILDPNDDYEIKIIDSDRQVKHSKPIRKEGRSFSFNIDFFPELIPGQEAFVKFQYTIPKYKVATSEYLNECLQESEFKLRDFEYAYFLIDVPTDKCIYELKFSEECRIYLQQPTVTWCGAPLEEESKKLRDNYTVTHKNGCAVCIEVTNPRVMSQYQIPWKPPEKREIQM